MRESLHNKCILFIENRDTFKAAFPFESSNLFPICASVLTDCDRVADAKTLKETRNMLKSRVSVFSNLRGACELPLLAMLDVDSDPDWRLDKTIEVYNCLKKRFFSSEYLSLAAMVISGGVQSERYEEVCERARRIYDLMKKEHPFLTSSEDCVFAALLALSDKSDGVLIRDIETCYETLKEKFHDRNALQSLSHVLALSGDDMMSAGDKCRNTMSLFDALKERKCKYGKSYELSSLGVLATLDRSINETADDIAEISAFLKGQKGYGFFGYDRAQRLLHAALILTSDVLGGSDTMTGAAIGSTVSMIAAQQAATCAIIVSCAATSVAVSSSAH